MTRKRIQISLMGICSAFIAVSIALAISRVCINEAYSCQQLETALVHRYSNMPWVGVRYAGEADYHSPSARPLWDSYLYPIVGIRIAEALDVDIALEEIGNSPGHLEEIHVVDCEISDLGANAIATIRSLERIEISGGRATKRGIARIASLPRLKQLKLNRLHKVTLSEVSSLQFQSREVQVVVCE
jgi:hypothetical protein